MTLCYVMSITLITPTPGKRAWLFSLCEKYMARQTRRWDQWLVVADGDVSDYAFTMGQQVIHRPPGGELHSVNENYLAALPHITGEYILPVEDDDWFSGDYIQVMTDALVDADLVGLAPDYYFHVPAKKWRDMKNTTHSSLTTSGFTRAVLPCFEVCARNKWAAPFIDMLLFPHHRDTLGGSCRIMPHDINAPLHVGIKGLSGIGAGLGHDPTPGIRDVRYQQLKKWIGDDAKAYIKTR